MKWRRTVVDRGMSYRIFTFLRLFCSSKIYATLILRIRKTYFYTYICLTQYRSVNRCEGRYTRRLTTSIPFWRTSRSSHDLNSFPATHCFYVCALCRMKIYLCTLKKPCRRRAQSSCSLYSSYKSTKGVEIVELSYQNTRFWGLLWFWSIFIIYKIA